MTPGNHAFLRYFVPMALLIGLVTTFSRVHFPELFWGWPLAFATSLLLLSGAFASSLARRVKSASDNDAHFRQALLASEERLRSLGDNLPGAYIYQCTKGVGGQLKFDYISSGVAQIHGYRPEEIIKDPGLLFQQVDPAQLPDLLASIAESERTLGEFSIDLRISTSDNQHHWLQLRSRPRRTSDGGAIWDGVAIDITTRREAVAMLDLQTRRSEALLEFPEKCAGLDEAGFMQYAIARIEALTDSRIGFIHFVNDDGESIELVTWSPNTLAHYCHAAFDRHYAIAQAGLWAEAARQKAPVVINDYANADHKHGLPEGHSTLIRLISAPVIDNDRVRMMAGVGNKDTPYTETDVETVLLLASATWRLVCQRRAEKALMIAMQVVNASPVICFRWRAAAGWPVVFVSENVATWGYSVEDLMDGKPPFAEMIHPDDCARIVDEVVRYTAEGRRDYVQEYRLLTADRQVIWVSDRTNVVRNEQGEVEFYDGILTDITERRQRALELTETLTAQRQLNKRLEEAHNQLLQSEKMASIGQLAAGIAHELNNPIGFVHSNLGTLEAYVRDLMEIIDAYDDAQSSADEPEVRQTRITQLKETRDFAYIRQDIGQLLNESRDGLSRVRKIVQDLKNFSHVSGHQWDWADLHQGLDSTLNIVWNELKYKCKVVKEFGDIPKVYCLISQLNQVFMNLLVNAGHAIETKGIITIRTIRLGRDEIAIEISDTGKGIAPEHLTRIFEPFFTTKPVGKGTGLGLSLAYGIINTHHGRIDVSSQLGIGTSFRVIIPIQPLAAESATTFPETSQ